jgi:ribose-phosphate pyrophosphokinase
MLNCAMDLHVFSGTAHETLARAIAEYLGRPLGAVEIRRFTEGEIFVKYRDNIRGSDVFVIQPTSTPPNENLMEMLIMLDAARRASAGRVTAVLPMFGYARQDRKDQPRVPITAKLVANLLVTAGANRVLTMDLHAQQIQGFFDIPVDHLYAAPVLVRYLRQITGDDLVVVAPDSGSVKMAQAYADMMDCGFAVVAKRRINAHKVESSHLVGDVADRDCVIVDDLTATASTLIEGARKLKECGGKRIFAAVSHCCLTREAHRALDDSHVTEMITTDSVPIHCEYRSPRLTVLSVAPLLGEAIRRIHERRSVSSLFRVKEEEA